MVQKITGWQKKGGGGERRLACLRARWGFPSKRGELRRTRRALEPGSSVGRSLSFCSVPFFYRSPNIVRHPYAKDPKRDPDLAM